MPDHQLRWEQVRDVLVKRRKQGQAPHWAMGWVAARVAKTEDANVNKAYTTTVLDYYNAHAAEDEDAIKARTWHRLIGFVDGLHNAELGEPAAAPEPDVGATPGVDAAPRAHEFDRTLVMDDPAGD